MRVAWTLLVGALGGGAAALAGLPLGWLVGALIATLVLSARGHQLTRPRRLRALMFAVIGTMVGSTFTPELIVAAQGWLPTLLATALYVAVTAGITVPFCRRFGRLDLPTAAMAGLPGGLSEMLAVGSQLNADIRVPTIVHGMRLVVLLLSLPAIAFVLDAGAAGPGAGEPANAPVDLALLLAAAVLGLLLARLLRLPAAMLLGPLIASAVVHAAGATAVTFPGWSVAIAQIVIGATAGTYFVGMDRAMVGRAALLGLCMSLMMLAIAAAWAGLMTHVLGVPYLVALLALIPGGLAEVSLLALALDADPIFVSVHQTLRVVLVVISLPLLLWVLKRASQKPSAT